MGYPSEQELAHIAELARRSRMSVIEMLAEAQSGHLAGSLGMADIFAALYGYALRHDPERPEWEQRDRLILSNGHIAPIRYATMAHVGYLPVEELMTLRALGSRLQGHPERTRLFALETTSGPLGDGLPQAAGIALAARIKHALYQTYVVTSDGEHQCGIVWEAAMFAAKNKLGALTNIVARNRIQIGGDTEEVMPLEPFAEKYDSFGWHVQEVDGHNISQFLETLAVAHEHAEQPSVIIAHTVPSKGVSEIEGDYLWHGKAPSKEQAERWIGALNAHQSRSMYHEA